MIAARRRTRPSMLVVALGLLAIAPPETPAQQAPKGVGSIRFPNSGARAAQPHFLRGVALLHSFAYDDAAAAFRAAQRADPSFALAYWGEALTHDHPLWSQHDSVAGRAVLSRLGPDSAARAAKARTARERAYLAGAEIVFGDGPRRDRYRAYAEHMRTMLETWPDDDEARAFYGLALLAVDLPYIEADEIRPLVRAAAVLEPLYRRRPDHPGAAHYLIHAYDHPVLSPLGMDAARRYASIAPAAEHALHMPSHIFVQQGMWDDVVASNEAAYAASIADVRRRGDPESKRDLHALNWLQYGYLMQGRVRDARAIDAQFDSLFGAEWKDQPRVVQVYGHANRLQVAAETGVWAPMESAALGLGIGLWRAGWSAWGRKDPATLAMVTERYRQRVDSAAATGEGASAALRASHLAMQAFTADLAGRRAEALRLMGEAADLEDRTPAFGPPWSTPLREIYAGWLLADGNAGEAAVQYDRALQRTPGRSPALLGRARAAKALGDSAAAARHYAQLAANWHRADADLPALAEVREGQGTPVRQAAR